MHHLSLFRIDRLGSTFTFQDFFLCNHFHFLLKLSNLLSDHLRLPVLLLTFSRSQRAMWILSFLMSRESHIWNLSGNEVQILLVVHKGCMCYIRRDGGEGGRGRGAFIVNKVPHANFHFHNCHSKSPSSFH